MFPRARLGHPGEGQPQLSRRGGAVRPLIQGSRLRDWARRLRRDTVALWIAARDPATPIAAKLLALTVAAYAFSPIDLVPDFIPVLGLLDDLVLLPLGIALTIRLIPPPLMQRFRAAADALPHRPVSRAAAGAVLLVWAGLAAALVWWLLAAR